MMRLGRMALAVAAGDPNAGDGYTPDTALVNYYDRDARLGMHQDKDERDDAPVVSLSVGDSCGFRFGNTRDRGRPYEDLLLASGDLFVFGGPVRFAYHGVTKVHLGTAPADCGLPAGRINIWAAAKRRIGFSRRNARCPSGRSAGLTMLWSSSVERACSALSAPRPQTASAAPAVNGAANTDSRASIRWAGAGSRS